MMVLLQIRGNTFLNNSILKKYPMADPGFSSAGANFQSGCANLFLPKTA